MQSTDIHNVSTGWKYWKNQLFISVKQFFLSFYPICKIETKYFVFALFVFACKDWEWLTFNFWLEGIVPVIYYSSLIEIQTFCISQSGGCWSPVFTCSNLAHAQNSNDYWPSNERGNFVVNQSEFLLTFVVLANHITYNGIFTRNLLQLYE